MLGRKIQEQSTKADDICCETGLGLLSIDTVMSPEKKRNLFTGSISSATGIFKELEGLSAKGYEIHMGISTPYEKMTSFTSDGTGYCKDNIYGTYVHGIFDKKEIAAALLQTLAKAAGKSIDTTSLTDRDEHLEQQYEKLADIIESSLDMKAVYEIMGIEHD